MLSTRQPTSAPIHEMRRGCRQLCTVGGAAVLGLGLVLGPTPLASAAPSSEAVDAINHRHADFGGNGGILGAPTGDPVDIQGGAKQDFSAGSIFYSPQTGAKVMYGQILEKYRSMGGPDSGLGFPLNDETAVGDGVGRFNDFSQAGGASIYWTPSTGATVMRGKLLDAWRASGGTTGPFGYPNADMTDVNGVSTAKFVGPQGTEMRWSDSAGLATVPAALATTIPGFHAGTPTLPPNQAGPAAPGPNQGVAPAPGPGQNEATGPGPNEATGPAQGVAPAVPGPAEGTAPGAGPTEGATAAPSPVPPAETVPPSPTPGATVLPSPSPGGTVLPSPSPNVNVNPPVVHGPARHHFNWWPLIIGLGLAALLASLLPLFRRRRVVDEVRTYPRPEPPAPRVTETRVTQRVREVPPTPPPVVPRVVERPVERRVVERPTVVEHRETVIKRPTVKPVVVPPKYEPPQAKPVVVNYDAERLTGIEVHYENNAIGEHQESFEDKSDTHHIAGGGRHMSP